MQDWAKAPIYFLMNLSQKLKRLQRVKLMEEEAIVAVLCVEHIQLGKL